MQYVSGECSRLIKNGMTYLMFLKRKRTGKVKARGCADGRPQREYISKEDSSSPTVSIYALMAQCVMNAIEGRKVVTCDIPGAFLQSDWPEDDDCYIRFEGLMVDMLCEIDPTYRSKVQYTKDGKKKFLYGKLAKAVYGTLMGSILFYNKLSKQLMDWGFEVNNYDKCTWNKIVDGEQLTVQAHVDDLTLSHKDQCVLDNLIRELNAVFGKEKKLEETKGDVHEYLGLTIDYSMPGNVVFSMFDYLEDIIVEAPLDLKVGPKHKTPASGKLFHVDKTSPLLNTEKAELFHRLVARLLFASKRARPDIQVAVAFLCTRVKNPTEEDYKKLGRLIRYVGETIHVPLILGADDLRTLVWNIDASYAVHSDMKSHTGASLSLGRGTLLSLSCKQKLVTKSSTEAELVGVDDAMTFVMWARYFFMEQTKTLPDTSKLKDLRNHNVIEQDNTSAIQLERNGKRSSTKRTQHINIRYFYVTDKVKDGDVSVIYKPTHDMVSDYLTKPLQGSLFAKHRDTLLGLYKGDYTSFYVKYKRMKNGV